MRFFAFYLDASYVDNIFFVFADIMFSILQLFSWFLICNIALNAIKLHYVCWFYSDSFIQKKVKKFFATVRKNWWTLNANICQSREQNLCKSGNVNFEECQIDKNFDWKNIQTISQPGWKTNFLNIEWYWLDCIEIYKQLAMIFFSGELT